MRREAILTAMLVTGCAAQRGDYPSLSRRPIENGSFDEPVLAPAALKPDPALDQKVATIAAALTDATEAFDKALPAANQRASAARNKPAGSDAWIDAQQSLAALDDGRARLSALATEADTAAGERAAALAPPYPPLDALNERIDAELARERAAADRLQAMLAPG